MLLDGNNAAQMLKVTDAGLAVGWHHVTATYSGVGGATAHTGITLYVDGVAVAQTGSTAVDVYTAMTAGAIDVTIGAYSLGTDTWMDKLDDVRIYDKELSLAQAVLLYNVGAGTEAVIIDTAADTTERGWAGESEGYNSIHKKIRRVMKSNRMNITVTNSDSRGLIILGVAIYYKLLPLVA